MTTAVMTQAPPRRPRVMHEARLERNVRQCICLKAWPTHSFSGRGDDLREQVYWGTNAHVAPLYLRRFSIQIVHGIKEEKIKEWREN